MIGNVDFTNIIDLLIVGLLPIIGIMKVVRAAETNLTRPPKVVGLYWLRDLAD